jgi:kynurenine formamidase
VSAGPNAGTNAGPAAAPTPTPAELDELFASLKNWRRWGEDDQRGALNHLTPAHRAAAAALVVDGTTVSMAHDFPVQPSPENPYPAEHHMLASGDCLGSDGIPGYQATRDYVGSHVHGLGVTHIDALCHMFVQGQMYNGASAASVRSDGAQHNSIMSLADGLVGRGVLLDIPAVRGVPHLEGGTIVPLADLEAAEAAEGVRVGPGDILLVATGRDSLRQAHGGSLTPAVQGIAGLHPNCLPWLHDRGVAVLGSDGISDAMPGLGVPGWPFPVHQVGITAIGLHLIDNMSLGALAERCAAAGRWAFLFTLAPLRIEGGTGCPVNPIAVL